MKLQRSKPAEIESMVSVLTSAIEARDSYTFGHSLRVEKMSARIGKLLGLRPNYIEIIQLAVRLHDLGKIGIPDSILLREGPLPDRDFQVIQKHPVIAEDIIKGTKALRFLLPFIKHHHERFDGYGYPDGLAGSDIPLGARLIAVADAIDAMLSDRPYRKALSVAEALSELKLHSGNHFDPQIVAQIESLHSIIKGLNFYSMDSYTVYIRGHDTVRHSIDTTRFKARKEEK